MGVLPVNPAGIPPDRLPPLPPLDDGLREKLRDEYDSGLDDVPSWRQDREREHRERIAGPAYAAALAFSAGIGDDFPLEP